MSDFEREMVRIEDLEVSESVGQPDELSTTSEQKGTARRTTLSDFVRELITGGRPKGGGSDAGAYVSIGGTQVASEGQLEFKDLTYIPEDFFPKVEATQLRRHDILVVKDGSNTGDVALVEEDLDEVVTNEHLFTLRLSSELNAPYASYFLQSHEGWKQLKGVITGSAQPGLTKGFVDMIRLDVPPLDEQRKIASVLYTVDQAIQKTEAIIEQAKRVKAGALQQLLTKGIEHTDYRRVHLGPKSFEVPSSWKCPSLENIAYKITDGAHVTPDYVGNGVPFLSTKNINPFEKSFDFSGYERYVTEEDHQKLNEKCNPEKGDVLICRRATIGPAQLVRTGEPFSIFVGLGVIKPSEEVMGGFLEQFFNWDPVIKMLNVKSPGSTMKTLNLSTLRKQRIPLPPLAEQKTIVDILSSIDQKISNEKSSKRRLICLKKGLMQDLLTGDVRTTDKAIEVLDEVAARG
jgi:type I restriction enzyme S subunit